jgi:hypothetical protein
MSQKMIGFAKVVDGLYYLQLSDKIVHVSAVEGTRYHTIPAQALWHFRLGHLGSNKLLEMCNDPILLIRVISYLCLICELIYYLYLFIVIV